MIEEPTGSGTWIHINSSTLYAVHEFIYGPSAPDD